MKLSFGRTRPLAKLYFWFYHTSSCLFVCLAAPHGMQSFLNQGSNAGPPLWECKVLTTGHQGSPFSVCVKFKFFFLVKVLTMFTFSDFQSALIPKILSCLGRLHNKGEISQEVTRHWFSVIIHFTLCAWQRCPRPQQKCACLQVFLQPPHLTYQGARESLLTQKWRERAQCPETTKIKVTITTLLEFLIGSLDTWKKSTASLRTGLPVWILEPQLLYL